MRLLKRRQDDDAAVARPGADVGGSGGDDEPTVRISRRRFARRQWARRWLAWRRVLVVALSLGAVTGCAWLVFFSSVLAVTGARVEGTSYVDPSTVRRTAAVPVGAPLATADLGDIAARVERLPAVRSVDVSRSWPDRVRIEVVEREAVAVVDRGEGPLRGVDASGAEFRTYPRRPEGLPLIRVEAGTGDEGSKPSSDALTEAATVAASLPTGLADQVRAISVTTVDSISLELARGRTVRWGSATDSRNKARVLAVLLSQRAAVYDVRVPGQPVIRK